MKTAFAFREGRNSPGFRAAKRKGAGILARGRKVLRILVKILCGIVSFAALALACFSLILAQPQEDSLKTPAPQPSLAASPSVLVHSESEISSLVSSFPVPVMSMVSNSGLEFVSGLAQDVSVDGATGRTATLTWRTQDGYQVVLQSIYPATALSLLKDGYHFVGKLGPTMFGSESVYMETTDSARLHARTDSAIYVVIVPKALVSRLTALSQSLQLLSP